MSVMDDRGNWPVIKVLIAGFFAVLVFILGATWMVLTAISANSVAIAELRGEMTGIRAEMTGIRAEMAGIRTEMAGIRGDVAGNTAAIAELRQAVTGNTAAIAELRGALLSDGEKGGDS